MSLSDSIEHPRLHAEVFDGVPTIAYEPGVDVSAVSGFETRRFPDISMYFGGVQAALWDPLAGFFDMADPRRDGAVAHGG
jgi:gamma-glutamyltranspeptidase/glutathione hydrolase